MINQKMEEKIYDAFPLMASFEAEIKMNMFAVYVRTQLEEVMGASVAAEFDSSELSNFSVFARPEVIRILGTSITTVIEKCKSKLTQLILSNAKRPQSESYNI